MDSPSWLDTLKGAGRTLVPSTLENIKDMAKGVLQTVSHPVQTAHTVGQIGEGAASNAYTALGGQPSAAKSDRARAEAIAEAAWAGIADKYSKVDPVTGQRHLDMDTFKHTLATNPGGILADVSMALPIAGEAGIAGKTGKIIGGLGKAAEDAGATNAALKLARAAQSAGQGVQNAGSAVTAVGKAANPLAAPIALAKKGVPKVLEAANATPRLWQQSMSGLPPKFLSDAFRAGKAGSAPVNGSEGAGGVFKRFASDQGSTEEIQQTATRALNAARQKASDEYLQGRAGLSTAPVDFQSTMDALDKSDSALNMGASQGFDAAKQAVAKARALVEDVATNPNSAVQNIENADALKRQIWDLRNSEPNAVAKQHLGTIYNSVKDSINGTDPGYGNLMESYQNGLQNIQDLTKTLGLGDKTASTAALAKQLKQAGKVSGQDLLDQLSKHEPSLPFMLAGHAAQEQMPNLGHKLLDAGVLGAGYHLGTLPAVGAGLASAAMSSPKIALNPNFLLGKGAGALSNVASKIPDPLVSAVKAVGDAVPSAETGTALAGQFSREEDNRPLTPDEAGISPRFFTGKDAEPTTDDAPEEDKGMTPEEAFGVLLSTDSTDSMSGANAGHPRPTAIKQSNGKWLVDPADPNVADTDDAVPMQRASGGSVKDIEHLVQSLMNRAKNEKKHASKDTEHFLKLPDSVVAKALAITQKAVS